MHRKTIRATMVKALAAGAMVAGLVGVAGVSSSSALVFNSFYVSPHGTTSVLNNCTNKSLPCLTIQQAVNADVAAGAFPSVINLAKGTYDQAGDQVSLTAVGDKQMTITGPPVNNGKFKATIDASSGTIFTVGGAATGVTLADVALNGDVHKLGGGASLGASVSGASNGLSTVSITNIDGSPASDAADITNGTGNNVTVGATVCSTATTADFPVSAVEPFALGVKGIPKCAGTLAGATVTIGAQSFTVDSAGHKFLAVLTGTHATDIPSGTPVVFAPGVSVFGAAASAVTCVSCTLTGSHLTGNGSPGQTGITVSGAAGAATVQGNSVSATGVGIASAPNSGGAANIGGALAGQGNTTSGDIYGILAEGAGGTGGTVSIVGNSPAGALAGIKSDCMETTNVPPQLNPITGNTASAGLGAAIALSGDAGQTIANNTTSGGLGMLLATSVTGVCAGGYGTTQNSFNNNTVNGGLLANLVVLGPYPSDPLDLDILLSQMGGAPVGAQVASNGNTFTGNSWTGGGLLNSADFNASHGQTAPACAFATLGTTIAPATAITSIDLKSANADCTLNPGTLLSTTGINQQLYVLSACNLTTAAVNVTCTVGNAIPPESLALNGGKVAGATVGISTLPTASSTNVFTGITNSSKPILNGGTYAGITGNAGYFTS